MPTGKIKVRFRDRKDHLVITLYKDLRVKFGIKLNSIILFEVNHHNFIRIPNKDFHITIPKKLIKNKCNLITIKILRVYNKEDCIIRDKEYINTKGMNFKAIIPKKTKSNKDLFVLDFYDYLYVWYSIGGGAEPVLIKKNIDLISISELAGFFFGDGNTSEGIKSFRLNNCEPSTLNHSLNILQKIGISRKVWKVQIIYSTNKDLTDVIKERCIDYWSKTLKFKKNQIVSVNKNKAKTESLEYGSARIFFDNNTFIEIMLNGVLKKFINIVQSPKNKYEKQILVGFIRGLAAAEACPILTKLGALSKVAFSFNPHNDSLNFYKEMLKNIGVNYAGAHGNELYIYGIKNFKIFNQINLFKFHKSRKEKFDFGYKNHKFSN